MDIKEQAKLKKFLRNWDGEGLLTKYGIDDLAEELSKRIYCEDGMVKLREGE